MSHTAKYISQLLAEVAETFVDRDFGEEAIKE